MGDDTNKRQGLVDFLKSYGWDEQKANHFLDSKVVTLRLKIPSQCLTNIVQEISREGIPTGFVEVNFQVPIDNQEAFKKCAREAIAKQGGFFFTSKESTVLANIDTKTVH